MKNLLCGDISNILASTTNNSNFFARVWDIIGEFYPQLLEGVVNTLFVSLVGTVVGLIIGVLAGIVRTYPLSKNKALRVIQKLFNAIIVGYIEIFRGTPMMVQAMVIFWGYAILNGGVILPVVPASLFIVSINTGAYMAEIVRGGIISISKGQTEGAYSIGMTHTQAMFYVVIPQMFRNILPSVSNEFVINIKDTSVLNVIGLYELYKIGDIILRDKFYMFETYLIICVVYFILTFTVTRLLRLCERLLEGKKNYTICGSQSDPRAEIRVKEGD